MKKILIFHPYLAPYRLDLYNRLSENFQIKVILTGNENEIQTLGFDLKYVNNQAKFDYRYINNGLYIGRHLISLIYFQEIKNFKPDIVLAHELGLNTLFSIVSRIIFKFKLWVTIDDSPEMVKGYNKLRIMLQRFVVRYSDRMLVVHPGVRDFLIAKFGSETQCDFIYFPIIQDCKVLEKKIEEAGLQAKMLSQSYDLTNKKVVLFVGRLEDVKSPELLLKAFYMIDDADTVLVFVGDGSLRKMLENQIKGNKKVLFTGRLSGIDLYAWYNLADVFVLPSKFEPFGAVVNEALVAGCWAIVSDKVGANCLVNESNGYIFKSEDLNDLTLGLSRLLNKKQLVKSNKMLFSFNDYVKIFDDFD